MEKGRPLRPPLLCFWRLAGIGPTALGIAAALNEPRGYRARRANNTSRTESRRERGPGRNATADWRQATDAAGRPAGASCRSASAASAAAACGCAGACRAAGSRACTADRARINRATSNRRQIRQAAAVGDVRITACYCNVSLDALDFSPVRHGRVLVAGIANAIAHLFAELVLVRVLLIRVGDDRTVVPPVEEAVAVMVRRLVGGRTCGSLGGGWVTSVRDTVGI